MLTLTTESNIYILFNKVQVLPAFWAGMQAPGAPPPLQQQQQQQQQAQQQQQPQQPQSSGASAQQQAQSNGPSTSSTSFQNLAASGVPLFPPPFPTMVPLPPIPTPPPNLTELSEEALRAMEGNLRQAVEARIQTLQRVQLLLDAANAMMNQYQTAAATAKYVQVFRILVKLKNND